MDETTRRIIERIIVKYDKPMPVLGGHENTLFFETARLTTSDLSRLAAEAVGDISGERFAVGVADTGTFFAVGVSGGGHVAIVHEDGKFYGESVKGHTVVIVDDVVCTGRRMHDAAKYVEKAGGVVQGFAVIIDRMETPGILDGKPVWSAYQAALK